MMTSASDTHFKEQLTLNTNHYKDFSTGNVGHREKWGLNFMIDTNRHKYRAIIIG